jgi:hypothetical protein
MSFEALQKSEELFYQVGLSASETITVLKQSMSSIEKFARFIAVYIYSVVLADDALLTNKELWEAVKVNNLQFDPQAMREQCAGLTKTKTSRSSKMPNNFVSLFRKAVLNAGDRPEPTGLPEKLSIVAGAK